MHVLTKPPPFSFSEMGRPAARTESYVVLLPRPCPFSRGRRPFLPRPESGQAGPVRRTVAFPVHRRIRGTAGPGWRIARRGRRAGVSLGAEPQRPIPGSSPPGSKVSKAVDELDLLYRPIRLGLNAPGCDAASAPPWPRADRAYPTRLATEFRPKELVPSCPRAQSTRPMAGGELGRPFPELELISPPVACLMGSGHPAVIELNLLHGRMSGPRCKVGSSRYRGGIVSAFSFSAAETGPDLLGMGTGRPRGSGRHRAYVHEHPGSSA